MSKSNRIISGLVASAFTIIVALAVWSDLKSGENNKQLMIKSDQSHGVTVNYYSPWNTSGQMENDRRGIWRIPNDGKPLIAKVVVVPEENQAIENIAFEYSLCDASKTDASVTDWHAVGVRQSALGFELALPTSASILFPKYGNVVNWRGDASLLGRPVLRIGYTFLLTLVTVSAAWLNRRATLLGLRSVYRELKPRRYEAISGVAVMCTFFALNCRNSNLPIVMIRHFDELSILRSIETLSPYDLIYGMSYNITCIPFVGPGLWFDSFSWAIVGGRMQSATSMLVCLLIFRRILSIYARGTPLHLLSLFPLTVPFFWIAGTLFRPDAQMTALLLCSWLFFLKDQGRFGFSCRIALVLFGAAIAVKQHALMFAPIIPSYVLFAKRRKGTFEIVKKAIYSAAVVSIPFLVLEPRLLSFTFTMDSIDDFALQLWTNQTGFDLLSKAQVSLGDKIGTVRALYSPLTLLVLLATGSLVVMLRQVKARDFRILPFHMTNLAVFVYYGWFINKDWGYYYISPFFMSVMVCVVQIIGSGMARKVQTVFALLLLLTQMSLPLESWRRVLSDAYMPALSEDEKERIDERKLEKLFALQGEDSTCLLSFNVPLDYLSMGITHSQVRYVATNELRSVAESDYGFLEDLRVQCVVLNKSQTMKNYEITYRLQANLPELGFVKVFEDQKVCAFRRK